MEVEASRASNPLSDAPERPAPPPSNAVQQQAIILPSRPTAARRMVDIMVHPRARWKRYWDGYILALVVYSSTIEIFITSFLDSVRLGVVVRFGRQRFERVSAKVTLRDCTVGQRIRV
jgi:hypothetical protein